MDHTFDLFINALPNLRSPRFSPTLYRQKPKLSLRKLFTWKHGSFLSQNEAQRLELRILKNNSLAIELGLREKTGDCLLFKILMDRQLLYTFYLPFWVEIPILFLSLSTTVWVSRRCLFLSQVFWLLGQENVYMQNFIYTPSSYLDDEITSFKLERCQKGRILWRHWKEPEWIIRSCISAYNKPLLFWPLRSNASWSSHNGVNYPLEYGLAPCFV